MAIREVLNSTNRTMKLPFPASTAVTIGNLLFWDSGSTVVKNASARADAGALVANQADFAQIFAGVSADQRLSTETDTTPTSDRMVVIDGIFDCDCASQTFELTDWIGIDRSSTPANYDSQVIKVSSPNLAIGIPVRRYTSATTKVRCRLTSSLFFSDWSRYNLGLGVGQGIGVSALADSAVTLTLDKGPILTMVPTAARNVTLPLESLSAGKIFFFTNNSGGANSVTFLASGGGSIKGNGVCPQNKTILLVCDGTNWSGNVSA